MRRYETSADQLEMRRLFLSIRTTVLIPAAWSIVTGAMFGMAVGGALRIIQEPTYLQWAIFVFAVAFIASWIMWLLWNRKQWNKINAEPHSNIPRSHFHYETTTPTENGKITRIYDIRYATPAQMASLADMIAANKGVTIPMLERLMGSRMLANLLLGELMDRSLLRWRNTESHKQGIDITRKGEVLFSQLANNPSLTRFLVPTDFKQVIRSTHTRHTQEDDDEEE